MRVILASLLDLVLPRSCLGCGRTGASLCARCGPRGAPLRLAGNDPPVAAGAEYDAAVRTALLAYKERGRRDLVRPLGHLLARAVTVAVALAGTYAVGSVAERVLLVPVPSSRAAARERGGDHVLGLARVAARPAGLRVEVALHLVRAVRDSAGLDTRQRTANLHLAMRAQAPPRRASALLVDDITTTGATLREAARALRAAGWPVRSAAVVAATPRRRHGHPGPSPGTDAASGLALG